MSCQCLFLSDTFIVASVAGTVIGNIMLVVIRSGLNFVLAKFELNLNSTYVTYVLTGIIVVVAVLMDVIKNKNVGKVKIETEKEKEKRLRKQQKQDIEDEIDAVLADAGLQKADKNAKVRELEAQLSKL